MHKLATMQPASRDKQKPWLVRVHYQMRTSSFFMLFVACSMHMTGKGYGLVAWLALGLVLVVYPQVQYVRSSRAVNPVRVELGSLVFDALLLGTMVAALALPLWITFSALMGTLSNNAVNKGWRGVRDNLGAFVAGALLWMGVKGFAWSPQTDWPTTLFCMVGLSGYLLAMGNIAFIRNNQLRSARHKLQLRETELLSANGTLQANLMEIDGLQHQLREQANRDPLTSLYNRRYLDSTLERELARCKREGHALSLIMIDIDHFKRINDTYGHQAGDQVLVRLGHILGGMARAGDIACRHGGEEFLLLMPTMPLGTAQERAEELRSAFASLVVPFGDFRLQATLSIGIAVYPGHGTSSDELMRSADLALYQAKNMGRNRVMA